MTAPAGWGELRGRRRAPQRQPRTKRFPHSETTIFNDRSASVPASTALTRARRVGILLAPLLGIVVALHAYGLSFNVTDSMPIGLYHVERLGLPVIRGTVVQACLPTPIAAVGRAQGYLMAGSCPDGAAPVLKIVAAAAGDQVQLLDRQIRVNGESLSGSATAATDSRGRHIAHVPRGTYRLTRDQLWFWTPNPRSWDSRYYGPVADRQVLGRATLLVPLAVWRFGNTAHFHDIHRRRR